MKINALTTFLDGRDRYEKDDERTVSDEDGARFVAAGWAEDLSGTVATGVAAVGATNLQVDNLTHKTEARNG